MKILVINAGSSSLKYQLIDMENESVIAKGLCERIGIEGSKLTHKAHGKEFVFANPMPDHTVAIRMVLDAPRGQGMRRHLLDERNFRRRPQNGSRRGRL